MGRKHSLRQSGGQVARGGQIEERSVLAQEGTKVGKADGSNLTRGGYVEQGHFTEGGHEGGGAQDDKGE